MGRTYIKLTILFNHINHNELYLLMTHLINSATFFREFFNFAILIKVVWQRQTYLRKSISRSDFLNELSHYQVICRNRFRRCSTDEISELLKIILILSKSGKRSL